MEKLKEESLSVPYNEIELPLISVLIDIEKNGVFLDMEYLAKLSDEFGESLNVLTDKINTKLYTINSERFTNGIYTLKIGNFDTTAAFKLIFD